MGDLDGETLREDMDGLEPKEKVDNLCFTVAISSSPGETGGRGGPPNGSIS